MAYVKRISGWLAMLCLFVLFGLGLQANAAELREDPYHYPDYDVATDGYLDFGKYITQVQVNVNGKDYTPAQTKELSDAGNPLIKTVGDSITFKFQFDLTGRAYREDDPTALDEEASTHVIYTNGTSMLNGDSVEAGGTGILDDSSLMKVLTQKGSSFLRMDIDWLLKMCPEDYRIEYTEGSVSFYQGEGDDSNHLYLYFPNGIGSNLYATPGYLSLTVTLSEEMESIHVPGTDGFFVPGTDGWDFAIPVRAKGAVADGYINAYGQITVKKNWLTVDGETHECTVVLHYKKNGSDMTASRSFKKDEQDVRYFTIQSDMSDCWLEELSSDQYESSLSVSEDGRTYTFTNTQKKQYEFSKVSDLDGGAELPGASMVLYRVESDGTTTELDKWTSTEESHKFTLVPGNYRLHENAAPAGYAVTTDIEFTVNSDYTVTVTSSSGEVDGNKIKVTDKALELKLIKQNENGDPLEGAKLRLTDLTQNVVVDEWTSTKEAHVIKQKSAMGVELVAGHTYKLEETEAPNGYALADPIEFVFYGDGTIKNYYPATITMTDSLLPTPTPSPSPTASATPKPGTATATPKPNNSSPTPTPNTVVSTATPVPVTPTGSNNASVQTGDDPTMWMWLVVGVICLAGAAGAFVVAVRKSRTR